MAINVVMILLINIHIKLLIFSFYSIIIHLYGRNSIINAGDVSVQFTTNIMSLYRSSDPRVIGYPQQPEIIAIDLSTSRIYNETGPLHPGATSSDGADPTMLAVFIGSWGCE